MDSFETVEGWVKGGGGDLWPRLTWANRPSMTGSEAPQALQDAWVATVLAIRELCGALADGTCGLINFAAAPLVEDALGEPVTACAGYGGFVGTRGRLECGFRWRPDKWSRWIDSTRGAHLPAEADVHCWLETATHVIDFSTGDTLGDVGLGHTWPPLINWPKWRFPKHPRDARGKGAILLWRNARAIDVMTAHMAPVIAPITKLAMGALEQSRMLEKP